MEHWSTASRLIGQLSKLIHVIQLLRVLKLGSLLLQIYINYQSDVCKIYVTFIE